MTNNIQEDANVIVNPSIWQKIKHKIPNFLRIDYPEFVTLMEHFYKFLESDTQNSYLGKLENILRKTDVSFEDNEYWDSIFKELGFNYSTNVTIPKRQLLHMMKDFLLSRGSPKSIEFMFKVMYGEDINITYPRDYMFEASSATYVNQYQITLEDNATAGFSSIESLKDRGNYDIAIGINDTYFEVDSFIVLNYGNRNFIQCLVSEEPILQDYTNIHIISDDIKIDCTTSYLIYPKIINDGYGYQNGDVVHTSNSVIGLLDAKVKNTTTGGIDAIRIISGGTGYKVGDEITASNEKGHSFYALIDRVSATGEVENINIVTKGYDYDREIDFIVMNTSEPMLGSGLDLVSVSTLIGGVAEVAFDSYPTYVGQLSNSIFDIVSVDGVDIQYNIEKVYYAKVASKHITHKGRLSTHTYLMDSHWFQPFSYVINSNISYPIYYDAINNTTHQSGWIFLGAKHNTIKVNLKDNLNINIKLIKV